MSKLWWDNLGAINTTSTSYTSIGSKYFAPVDCRLRMIRLSIAGDAATSLIESCTLRITSPEWGRSLVVGGAGAGLRTVPAIPIPNSNHETDLPVKASQGLDMQAKFNVTAVTPDIQVYGLFESAN